MRTCIVCSQRLCDTEFYVVNPATGRRDTTCKTCRKAKIRGARAADPESFRERGRESYRRHRESNIARVVQWQKDNPDAVRERTRRWQKKNPDKVRDAANRRRARLMASEVEKIDRARVFERDGGKCHICGKRVRPAEFEVDHLTPISKGGPHTYENVATAHRSCNRRRSDGVLPAQLLLIG